TVAEIRRDGYEPAAEIPIWSTDDTSLAAAVDTGEAIAKFARELERLRPDVVVVLGDRLEAFAMASAATILLIPVAHIHGGELTMGAMDDSLRHAITKLSFLHFATTEEHRDRVIQLGEEPSRVFNFGAPVLDAIANLELLSREALEDKFGVRFGTKNTVLMTFHPAAFDEASAKSMIGELLAAMEALTSALDPSETQLIITGTNNDIGSGDVREAIAAFAARLPDRVSYVESFGQLGYLSVMSQVNLVTGNSSSTVLEAPVLGVPSVLIGNRQEGRPMSASVLKPARADRILILEAMQNALNPEFRARAAAAGTPFGLPGFAQKATAELMRHEIPSPPKKKFWSAN
ncbi:MAG: hypothetical protein RLZZ304_674, partial [Actinomycetota bacterium]